MSNNTRKKMENTFNLLIYTLNNNQDFNELKPLEVSNNFLHIPLNDKKNILSKLINQNIYFDFELLYKEVIQKNLLYSDNEKRIYAATYVHIAINLLLVCLQLKEYNITIKIGENALSIIELINFDDVINDKSNIIIQQDVDSVKLSILYDLGNTYLRCNNIEKAIEKYEIGKKYNHMQSIYTLANIYYYEDYGYYNINIANDLYLKAAELAIKLDENKSKNSISENDISFRIIETSLYQQVGRIMFERKNYDLSLKFFKTAKSICLLLKDNRYY